MKIKIDENLPVSLAKELEQIGHDTHTVFDEQLAGVNDARLWEAAQLEGRFFITQDLDFSNIQQFRPGSHHGILLVRLHQPGRLALVQHIRRVFLTENTSSWAGCFLVLTEHKLRIRRPSQ